MQVCTTQHQRFARILQLHAVGKHCEAHIQWLEHSSLHLQEAHHPSELFLLPICDRVDARHFKKKLDVRELAPQSDVPDFSVDTPDDEFFVRYASCACLYTLQQVLYSMLLRFCLDPSDSSLQSLPGAFSIPDEEGQLACTACAKSHEHECALQPELTHAVSLRFRGELYKIDDYVYFDTNQAVHASDASSSESLGGRAAAPSTTSRVLPIGRIRVISSARELELREYERTDAQVRILLFVCY